MDIKRLLCGTFSWKRFISSVFLIYLGVSIFVYFYAERLIFPYHDSSYDASLSGLGMIKLEDGLDIATRFWPVIDDRALVLYFHGNYEDLGHLDEVADLLNAHGYSVLAMDYRGYGLSQGLASEGSINKDAELVYKKALDMNYADKDIIVVGRSIGSGVATELATKHQPKALVLISAFTSTFRVMTRIKLFPFDRFDNLAKINQVTAPLIMIHGTDDQLIKPWHTQALFEKFEGEKHKILVDGAGHNDMWDDQYRYFLSDLMVYLSGID